MCQCQIQLCSTPVTAARDDLARGYAATPLSTSPPSALGTELLQYSLWFLFFLLIHIYFLGKIDTKIHNPARGLLQSTTWRRYSCTDKCSPVSNISTCSTSTQKVAVMQLTKCRSARNRRKTVGLRVLAECSHAAHTVCYSLK